MEPSATAYDDSFRTLLNDCRKLIIPVVNEAFGEDYTGQEEVVFAPNEHFLNQEDGTEEKRITDSNFIIVGADGAKKRYHIECETNLDDTIILRIFEYDAQIALNDGKREFKKLDRYTQRIMKAWTQKNLVDCWDIGRKYTNRKRRHCRQAVPFLVL